MELVQQSTVRHGSSVLRAFQGAKIGSVRVLMHLPSATPLEWVGCVLALAGPLPDEVREEAMAGLEDLFHLVIAENRGLNFFKLAFDFVGVNALRVTLMNISVGQSVESSAGVAMTSRSQFESTHRSTKQFDALIRGHPLRQPLGKYGAIESVNRQPLGCSRGTKNTVDVARAEPLLLDLLQGFLTCLNGY